MTFHSGDSLDISYLTQHDELDADFEIRPGIVIPEGDYHLDTFSFSASTEKSRILSGYLFTSFGKYFDGDRASYSLFLTFKPSKHYKIVPGITKEKVDLPAGSFDVTFTQATVEYTLSRKTFINALLQWNDDLDEVSTNLRFNYKYRPGSDIYLVYNKTRDRSEDGQTEQAIILKLTKLWSF